MGTLLVFDNKDEEHDLRANYNHPIGQYLIDRKERVWKNIHVDYQYFKWGFDCPVCGCVRAEFSMQ